MKLAKRHPETLPVIEKWHKVSKRAQWNGLHEVRAAFPSADQVGTLLVFDILGGNYRLIVRVSYTGKCIWVKELLTHTEYDRKEWMKWA